MEGPPWGEDLRVIFEIFARLLEPGTLPRALARSPASREAAQEAPKIFRQDSVV